MSVVDRLIDLLARLPSTNARIAVSLLLATATGARVIATNEAPPWEWLLFLGGMMGIDLAQFVAKRRTHQNGAPPEGTPAP